MVFGAGEIDPTKDTVFAQLMRAGEEFAAWDGFTLPLTMLVIAGFFAVRRDSRDGPRRGWIGLAIFTLGICRSFCWRRRIVRYRDPIT